MGFWVAELSYSNQKDSAPKLYVEPKKTVIGERSPGFSKLELEIERTANGKYRVKNYDPEGPFKDLVYEGQEFDKLEDIPKPHSN